MNTLGIFLEQCDKFRSPISKEVSTVAKACNWNGIGRRCIVEKPKIRTLHSFANIILSCYTLASGISRA